MWSSLAVFTAMNWLVLSCLKQVVEHLVSTNALKLQRGTVTCALGNLEAIKQGTRGSTHDGDLNRMFPRDPPRPTVTYNSHEMRRAEILRPFLQTASVLLDLHATNKPSQPFVRVAGPSCFSPQFSSLIDLLPVDTVLYDPEFTLCGQVPKFVILLAFEI